MRYGSCQVYGEAPVALAEALTRATADRRLWTGDCGPRQERAEAVHRLRSQTVSSDHAATPHERPSGHVTTDVTRAYGNVRTHFTGEPSAEPSGLNASGGM
jgi:hypothetical protein